METEALAVIVVFLAVLSVWASCGTCEQRQATAYPELERAAEDTLRGLSYTLDRGGSCEDTGKPGASVQATMKQWRRAAPAKRVLRRHGWQPDGGGFHNAKGSVRADATVTRDADGDRNYIIINFIAVSSS